MSRRDDHLNAMLRHLGATYYQTLHGDARASEVASAVASVHDEAARRPEEFPLLQRGDQRRRTGRWRVRDVMRTSAVAVERRTPAREIARLMSEHRVSAVPVLAGRGRVLGVVSEADLLRSRARRRALLARLSGRSGRRDGDTAAELMTSPAITVHPDAPLAAAARLMDQRRLRMLPVVNPAGDLVGVVSRRNLLSIFLRPDEEIAGEVRAVLSDVLLIDDGTVTVSAQDGVVTLSGPAEQEDSRQAAVRLAGEVDGVLTVIDKLSAPPEADRPATGS
jgi:CBS domain-containing protein